MPRQYFTPEGVQLAFVQEPFSVRCITLELASKWYRMWMVLPSGMVQEVPSGVVLDQASPGGYWVDHLYHPRALDLVATYYGGIVDNQAREMALGRWIVESSHSEMMDLCEKHKFYDLHLEE